MGALCIGMRNRTASGVALMELSARSGASRGLARPVAASRHLPLLLQADGGSSLAGYLVSLPDSAMSLLCVVAEVEGFAAEAAVTADGQIWTMKEPHLRVAPRLAGAVAPCWGWSGRRPFLRRPAGNPSFHGPARRSASRGLRTNLWNKELRDSFLTRVRVLDAWTTPRNTQRHTLRAHHAREEDGGEERGAARERGHGYDAK